MCVSLGLERGNNFRLCVHDAQQFGVHLACGSLKRRRRRIVAA